MSRKSRKKGDVNVPIPGGRGMLVLMTTIARSDIAYVVRAGDRFYEDLGLAHKKAA